MAMGKSWRCGSFSIQRFDDLLYQIYFGTQETVDFVLNNGPWNFENNLVLVQPRSSTSPNLHLAIDKELFWVLLTSLPRYCYTMDVGLKLTKLMEDCQTMQLREDRVLGTKFFLFRIVIHLNKPLKRLMRVTTPDGTMHVGLLKYKPLPTFCFCCGLIGHRYRTCARLKNDLVDVDTLPYGPWMGGVDHMFSDQLYSVGSAAMEAHMSQKEPASSSEPTLSIVFPQRDSPMPMATDKALVLLSPKVNNLSTPLPPSKRSTVTVVPNGDSTPKKKKLSSTVEVVWQPRRTQ